MNDWITSAMFFRLVRWAELFAQEAAAPRWILSKPRVLLRLRRRDVLVLDPATRRERNNRVPELRHLSCKQQTLLTWKQPFREFYTKDIPGHCASNKRYTNNNSFAGNTQLGELRPADTTKKKTKKLGWIKLTIHKSFLIRSASVLPQFFY